MARAEHMAALSVQEWALIGQDLCLSPRQAEIVRLIAEGMSDKQIGWQLGISFGTLRTHMSRLFQKCSVNDRMELLAHVYMRLHRHWQNRDLVLAQSGNDMEFGRSPWIQP